MSGSTMVRKTSIAIQKVQQKHSIDLLNKRTGSRRCKQLRMISGDIRIGKGYDFKAGGKYEDLSFEKERTLLQLWEIYRNGYTTDQVLECMYIPVIVFERGGRVRSTQEYCNYDQTMILELRARYAEIKEEELIQREEEELAKYNEMHSIHLQNRNEKFKNSVLLDALSCGGSPKPSRPHSVLSCKACQEQEFEEIRQFVEEQRVCRLNASAYATDGASVSSAGEGTSVTLSEHCVGSVGYCRLVEEGSVYEMTIEEEGSCMEERRAPAQHTCGRVKCETISERESSEVCETITEGCEIVRADSPFSRSLDQDQGFEDDEELIKPEKEPYQLLCYCFHSCCFTNEE